jgi:uncharacterized protein (DUF1015 family)
MTIYPFTAIYPNLELIASPDVFFETVKFEYTQYYQSGFFKEDEGDALMIYEIRTRDNTVHRALISCTDIRDYLEGKILRHENTLVAKEQQMMNLLLQRNAMIKPVVLAYRGEEAINKLIADAAQGEPFIKIPFVETEELHVIYKVTDKEAQAQFIEAFREIVPKVYIADGHHRCSTAAKLFRTVSEKYDNPLDFSKLLCAFFSFDQLVIHDYNRVIEVLHEISPTVFIARLSRLCTIKELKAPRKPLRKHEMTLYIEGEWYRLRWRRSILRKYADKVVILDGHILNEEVLKPILQIGDMTSDQRLRFVEGIAGIEGIIEKTNRTAFRIAFCIYPVSVDELIRVADAAQTLPPKSTWFEPRIKNGVVAKSF